MRLIETFGLYTLCGAVAMLVTWPTTRTGRRFLRRWTAADDPSDEQVALAVRRLRERRLLVLPLMTLAPLTAGAVSAVIGYLSNDLGLYHLLGSLLVSLLLADLLVSLHPRRGSTRTATLVRRRWQDLVPRWAVALHVGLTALAVGLAVVGLAAQPWVDELLDRRADVFNEWDRANLAHLVGWSIIVAALLGLLVVYAVVRLAVVRRASTDELVDAALRISSARVAVGIGIWLAELLGAAGVSRLLFLVKLSPETAPGWLQAAAPVTLWLSVATFVLVVWGWSSVVAAPRHREAGGPA